MATGMPPVGSVGGRGFDGSEAPIWRLSVEQYHAMIRTGILTDDDPVELLRGWLVTKMPKKPAHRLSTELTRQAIEQQLPEGWHVNVQEPVTSDDSEPEPDVSVVRGDRRDYADRHPGAGDVALVIEVADASLARDLGLKKTVYAHALLPVYWVVNLVEGRVEVFAEPTGPAETPDYLRRDVYGPADDVPLVIDGREIARIPVRTLLP